MKFVPVVSLCKTACGNQISGIVVRCGMTKRDDFRAKTKRTLEARAGHRCSNPGCQRPTSGPAVAENKAVSIGKAAHITAAAINGPRYDSSLSPEDRRAETNGIWLCSVCADLIDTDEKRFPEDLVRQWKQGAVEYALKDILTLPAGTYRRPAVTIELDEDDRSFLQSLVTLVHRRCRLVMPPVF
jgi:hypothetical protein